MCVHAELPTAKWYIEREILYSTHSGEISGVYYVLLEHIIWNLYLNLNTLCKGFLVTLLVYSDWLFSLLLFTSKVPRPDKLAVHVFEVDEDVDKDEVSKNCLYIWLLNTGEAYTENVCHHYDVIFLSYSLGELQRPYFQFAAGKEIKRVLMESVVTTSQGHRTAVCFPSCFSCRLFFPERMN